MTKNQDKRHLTLKSVFYPSLKRKMDKAKFILLGFIIIMAVVIAGCPMELNTNIGLDTSNIKKEPGKTVTEEVPVPVPGDTEYIEVKVDVNRLRVINLSKSDITQVSISTEGELLVPEKILPNTSKMWIVKSINPHPATSPYTVSSTSFMPAGTTVPVTMPPDAVIVVEDTQTVLLPPGDGTVPGPNQAFIIIYNMSQSHDIKAVLINTTSEPDSSLLKRTGTPSKFKKNVTAPGTYILNVDRTDSPGAPVLPDQPITVAAGDIVSVFIGDTETNSIDSMPPGPVVDLVLTADHGLKQIIATWKKPIDSPFPTDFAGYTVYLDDGTSVDIADPSASLNPPTWDSATIYPPATVPLSPLPNGPYAVAVSSRDASGNLSEPVIKSIAILDVLPKVIVIPDTVLFQPVMYAPARLEYNATDWSAKIEWSATGNGGSTLPEPLEPKEITGIPRFRGGVTYTPKVTVTAKNGKGFLSDTEIHIGNDPQPTLVTASSNSTEAKTVTPFISYARTEVGGKNWYVGRQNFDTLDNSKTGATYADAVIGLEVVLERIKSERAWASDLVNASLPAGDYAAVHIGYYNARNFNSTLTLDDKYPPTLYIQGDTGTSVSNGDSSRIHASAGPFAEVVDSRTLVIGGNITIEGSGDASGAIQVGDGTLVLTSHFMKADGTMNTFAYSYYPVIKGNAGSGVYVSGGKVYMYSGTITLNGRPSSLSSAYDSLFWPNVTVGDGEFHMYNGVIANAPGYNVSVYGLGKFFTEDPPSNDYTVTPSADLPSISNGTDGAMFLGGYSDGETYVFAEAALNRGSIANNGARGGLGAIVVGDQAKLTLGKVVIENNTGYGIHLGGMRERIGQLGDNAVILNCSTDSTFPKIQNNTKTGIYMKANKRALVRMITGTITGNNTDYNKPGVSNGKAGGIHVRDSGKNWEDNGNSGYHNPWTDVWTPDTAKFPDGYYSRLEIQGGTISGNYGSAGYSGGVHYQQYDSDTYGNYGFSADSIHKIRFSFLKTGGIIKDNITASPQAVGKQVHISHSYSGWLYINDGTQNYQHDLKIDTNLGASDDLTYGAFGSGLKIDPNPSTTTWATPVPATTGTTETPNYNSQTGVYAVWK